MSLRVKLILALTLLASAATAAIGIASYRSTAHQLQSDIDNSLDDAARRLAESPDWGDADHDGDGHGPSDGRPRSFEQVLIQIIAPDGTVLDAPGSGQLPVDDDDLQVAMSGDPDSRVLHDVEVEDENYRMLTVASRDGAVQFARSLSESRESLESILHSTLFSMAVVALVSAVLGWVVAHGITRRLERLTTVAGVVASTGRLDIDVPTDGRDETGQLGRALSGMLSALHTSREEQHRLVQDASHELRTPLTSLRTNVAVLRRRFSGLDEASREQLLADLDSETRELTDLVNELVELATDKRDDEIVQEVRLADVAERAAARARRRTGRTITLQADDSVCDGQAGALERAVQNLIDNACKFATEGDVEVSVTDGRLVVRDHGPGIPADDLEHIFDRFYRSVEMRSRPGSGLGLAIVRSIVERHGGEVFAGNAPGGGAEIGFWLPVVS